MFGGNNNPFGGAAGIFGGAFGGHEQQAAGGFLQTQASQMQPGAGGTSPQNDQKKSNQKSDGNGVG